MPITSQEDVQEDWGWKLVHGEVFRTPRFPLLLSIMVGNGTQLCAMCGVTLGPHCPHYLNHPILTVVSVFSVCASRVFVTFEPRITGDRYDDLLDVLRRVRSFLVPRDFNTQQSLSRIGGYFSSRVYTSLGGTDRRKNAFLTATALPT